MRGSTFGAIAALIVAIDLLIPYLLIGARPLFGASYLFWCALAAAVIGFGVIATRRWGGDA